jgi:hypothetical protein
MSHNLFQRAIWRVQRFMGKGQKAWDDQFRKGIWGGDTCSPHVLQRVINLCRGAVWLNLAVDLVNFLETFREGLFPLMWVLISQVSQLDKQGNEREKQVLVGAISFRVTWPLGLVIPALALSSFWNDYTT